MSKKRRSKVSNIAPAKERAASPAPKAAPSREGFPSPRPEIVSLGLLALMLAAMALALDTSLHNQSLPKTFLFYAGLPAALVFLPWRRPRASFLGLSLGGFLAYLLASALLVAPEGARADALEEWLRWGSGGLLALAAASLAFRLKIGARLLFRAWAGAGVLTALYGFAQVMAPGLDPLSWTKRERLFSTWANPTFAAGLYASLLPWCAGELIALRERRAELSPRRWGLESGAWAGAGLILGFALLLTFSRGGWLAAAGALGALAASLALLGSTRGAFLGFLGALLRGRRSALPALGLLAAGSLAVLLATWPGLFQASRRARVSQADAAATLNVRLYAWGAAKKAFSEKPLLGHGLGTYQRLFPGRKGPEAWRSRIGDNTIHAHSEPAELAAETGTLGLGLALLALLAWTWGIARRLNRPGADPAGAILTASLMACAFAAFMDSFWGVHFRWTSGAVAFWLPAGLAWGLSRRLAESTPESSPPLTRNGLIWRGALALALALAAFFPASRVAEASRQLREGELLFRGGATREALAHYRESARLNPWLLEARYRLGALLLIEDKPAEALDAWKRLHELGAPLYASLAMNETRALLALDRRADALARWRDAEAQDRSPGSALLAAEIAEGWPSLDALPEPLRLIDFSFAGAELKPLERLSASLAKEDALAPSLAWTMEALRRGPSEALPALRLADWLNANHRPGDAADLLEACLRVRKERRADWRSQLAEAGPQDVKRTLAEEGRLRFLRAQAMENAFYSRRPNQAAPMTPQERREAAAIREAYADAKLWLPNI